MAEIQAKLQTLSDEYQKLQQARERRCLQGLTNRFHHSIEIGREFEKLGEDETIYKLMGPVLLKQDKLEAESTVKGRLDFIAGEVTRLETQIKETQDELEKKKAEIIQIQASAQAAAGGKAPQK
ncbi:Prefoldin subunit 6 [Metarhizium anisopliae]